MDTDYLNELNLYLIKVFNRDVYLLPFNMKCIHINDLLELLNTKTEYEVHEWMLYYIFEEFKNFNINKNNCVYKI